MGCDAAVRFRPNTKSRACAQVCVHVLCAVRFRPDTKSGEGGGFLSASGPIRKVRGGGGVVVRRTLTTGLNNILYIYQTPQYA